MARQSRTSVKQIIASLWCQQLAGATTPMAVCILQICLPEYYAPMAMKKFHAQSKVFDLQLLCFSETAIRVTMPNHNNKADK